MSVPIIPLFAEKPSHPFVPLGRRPASAHSEGQGRPPAGASRAPFTGASTLAGWRRSRGVSECVLDYMLFEGKENDMCGPTEDGKGIYINLTNCYFYGCICPCKIVLKNNN